MQKVNIWREVAALGLILMSLSWIIPWFQAFTRVTTYPTEQVALVIGVILLVAYAVGKAADSMRLKTEIQVGLIGLLILLSLLWGLSKFMPDADVENVSGSLSNQAMGSWWEEYSVIPRELLVIVALLFVWWWGLRLTRERIGPHMAIKHFQIGSILLLLYAAVIAGLVGYHPPVWIYVLFLFSGLIAMGAARVSVVGYLRGGRRSPFNRRWLGEMVVAAVIMLAIAAITAVFFTGQSERIVGWLEGLAYILGLIVASPLLLILALLAGWLNEMDSASFEIVPESDIPLEEVENADPAGMPFVGEGAISEIDLVPILQSALTWIVVILALYVLYKFLRRTVVLMRMRWRDVEDESGAYSGLGGLGQLLRDVLLGEAQQAVDGFSRRLNRKERIMAAEQIRNIYAQLLDLSEELGHSRPASITPLEFLPELDGQFSGLSEDLRVITTAYVDIRYGELPETQGQLEAVENAWQRVRIYGEARRKEMKRKGQEAQTV
ncbi:MAG: DUF4129 domain-containing protein [Gammaproteobacteria bacterium]|nr:DUF4129 domain-containing protein [Gammaproteobacteria bacterium]